MRWLMIWIAGASAVSVNAVAQGPLKDLRLEAPPTQTLFCSVGDQVQLSLTGTDDRRAPTPLDRYKIRIWSSNPDVVSAQGRAPSWTVIDAACRADGDAWILVDANGVRTWMRALVGSARTARAVASAPPESLWSERLGATLAGSKIGAVRTAMPGRATAPGSLATNPVAAVTLSATPATLEQGSTQQIIATPRDAAGAALGGRAVSWQSSNPAIAGVDANGVVTGVEVGGPVTITATSEATSATAPITVTAIPPAPPGGYSLPAAINIGSMYPGQSIMRRDYFASTGDSDRWYAVTVYWPQPSGCAAGVPIGPTFSVSLTNIPAGRQYDLSLRKGYNAIVEESKQPGTHDRNISVGGACGTTSVTFYVWVHRTSGLPSSTPFTLRFVQGT